MNCPKCNHEQSRVIDLKRKPDGLRRGRVCAGCGHKFNTLERVEIWDPTLHGYVAPGEGRPALAVVPAPPAAAPKKVASARHEASPGEDCLSFVSPEARLLLVQWWNESRKSKHRANATWTRAAWEASVQRVANLPTDLQLALCRAGVEHGWQALKLDYIKDELAKPTAAGRPMPKDPSMRAALESWPKPA
jgi:hypothetical protein